MTPPERKAGEMEEKDDKAEGLEFVSRYSVFGPPNGCVKTPESQCEGTGFIPIKDDEHDPLYRTLWFFAEAQQHSDDGWHFIPCPICKADDPHVLLARRMLT